MKHKPVKQLYVYLQFDDDKPITVGRLASHNSHTYFEYDEAFLQTGLELSPLHLPLKAGLYKFNPSTLGGLAGLFDDSLPDGWGRLLLDRSLRLQGILPDEVGPLDRLARIGPSGMGALVYRPEITRLPHDYGDSLDTLADQARQVWEGEAEDALQALIELNGSSAGARPKVMVGVDDSRRVLVSDCNEGKAGFEPWLVKFANRQDSADAGAVEYVYALMARNAGVKMMDCHLFPSRHGAGYFATQRFDRFGQERRHVHSVAGLLHADFRTPSLDYEDLLNLTSMLTRDSREVTMMFRYAVFNVLAHNRDDHAKNFSFIMDREGGWRLAPAYDLTFSAGPGGEQSMTVLGEGKEPSRYLMNLALAAGLKKSFAEDILVQTRDALARFPELASNHGVSRSTQALITQRLGLD